MQDHSQPDVVVQDSFWDRFSSWEEALRQWEEGAARAVADAPNRGLAQLPKMPGITQETAKGLKWKSLKYMVTHDQNRAITKNFFRHPLRYSKALAQSCLKSLPFQRDGDFFCYGVESYQEFMNLLEEGNSVFVVGYSYCHKPHECPSGRFNDQCIADPENPTCRQCFIGKALHAMPKGDQFYSYIIPTVHYIGEKMFELRHRFPKKRILFLISACELCLTMFGDWGNMINAYGLGIRLDGRICNTMRAFELSEVGIKPGLTVILPDTQAQILKLIKALRQEIVN
jgi:hypothetical protein